VGVALEEPSGSSRIDIRIESAIVDTSPWVAERTIDSLPDFIAKGGGSQQKWGSGIDSFFLLVTPSLRLRLSQKSKVNGAPTLIFIAGSALRVADVVILLQVVQPKRLFTPRPDKGSQEQKTPRGERW